MAPPDQEAMDLIRPPRPDWHVGPLTLPTRPHSSPNYRSTQSKWGPWRSHHPVQTDLHGVKAGVLHGALAAEVFHRIVQLQEPFKRKDTHTHERTDTRTHRLAYHTDCDIPKIEKNK